MTQKQDSIIRALKSQQRKYGIFAEQAETAQAIKNVMRTGPGWYKLAADQKEALELDATKTSRILHGDPDYVDTWHDKSGYAMLIEYRLLGESL